MLRVKLKLLSKVYVLADKKIGELLHLQIACRKRILCLISVSNTAPGKNSQLSLPTTDLYAAAAVSSNVVLLHSVNG